MENITRVDNIERMLRFLPGEDKHLVIYMPEDGLPYHFGGEIKTDAEGGYVFGIGETLGEAIWDLDKDCQEWMERFGPHDDE